jgi:NADH:ubiquinone oxidoreductase subunit H
MFLFKVLLVIVPALLSVAYVTVAKRKTMASMQKRFDLKLVEFYVLFQALALASNILGSIFKKFVIISLFNKYINIYLKHFRVNFQKHLLNHSLNKSLDFSIDSLIVKIYIDVRNINPLIFFILGYCIYNLLGDRDLILIYLSYFISLIGVCIILIILVKN